MRNCRKESRVCNCIPTLVRAFMCGSYSHDIKQSKTQCNFPLLHKLIRGRADKHNCHSLILLFKVHSMLEDLKRNRKLKFHLLGISKWSENKYISRRLKWCTGHIHAWNETVGYIWNRRTQLWDRWKLWNECRRLVIIESVICIISDSGLAMRRTSEQRHAAFCGIELVRSFLCLLYYKINLYVNLTMTMQYIIHICRYSAKSILHPRW